MFDLMLSNVKGINEYLEFWWKKMNKKQQWEVNTET